MTAKTYTKRENAKRAAIAAGVPAELVQITFHRSSDEMRFGWKQKSYRSASSLTPTTTARVRSCCPPNLW